MGIDKQSMNRNLATVGWGALFIWWGISIVIDPITIGTSAIGTGLILLGVNAVRMLNGIPTNGSTTAVGVIALVWGALDHALSLQFGVSFATMMIVIGIVVIASLVTRPKTA